MLEFPCYFSLKWFMKTKIVLAGGGTGGHLFPLITVMKKIQEDFGHSETIEFLYIGPDGIMEKTILEKTGVQRKIIFCGKLRRYFSLLYLIDLIKFPIGIIQSLWYLWLYMPDVVFAKGGYASVPVVLAAKIYAIPVIIHESDTVPGLANKFLGSIVDRVAITFERAKMYFPSQKVFLSGLPVRKELLNGNPETARQILHLEKNKPVLLILGGSQGAEFINNKVINLLKKLTKKFQIIHQTGEKNFDRVVYQAKQIGFSNGQNGYYPIAFIGEEMKDFLALADIVLARSSATHIAEIAACRKPLIVVPGSFSANNHQFINARELSLSEAAIVIEESNLTENIFLNFLDKLLNDQSYAQKLVANLSKFYIPSADKLLAEEIMTLAKK